MSKTKVATGEMLKDLQPDAMIYRGECSDLDTATVTGFYNVMQGANGIPDGAYPYGVLRVYKTRMFVIHEYVPHQAYGTMVGGYLKRVLYTGKWTKWEHYAPTSILT